MGLFGNMEQHHVKGQLFLYCLSVWMMWISRLVVGGLHQSSRFLVLSDLTLIPMVCTSKNTPACALHWYILLYKETLSCQSRESRCSQSTRGLWQLTSVTIEESPLTELPSSIPQIEDSPHQICQSNSQVKSQVLIKQTASVSETQSFPCTGLFEYST